MKLESLILVIPAKEDPERDAVAEAWMAAGGEVVRLDRFWELLESLDRARVRLYGNDTFCLVLAQKLRLELVIPEDRLLATAPESVLRRRVRIARLDALEECAFPIFVKPVIPKQFRAAVYSDLASLLEECRGLEPATEVLVSESVRLKAEVRSFVLDGAVRTVGLYEGEGDLGAAARFAEIVASSLELPRTCAIDVGLLDEGRWALIETNATWGAGLNGCDPQEVVPCIAAATRSIG